MFSVCRSVTNLCCVSKCPTMKSAMCSFRWSLAMCHSGQKRSSPKLHRLPLRFTGAVHVLQNERCKEYTLSILYYNENREIKYTYLIQNITILMRMVISALLNLRIQLWLFRLKLGRISSDSRVQKNQWASRSKGRRTPATNRIWCTRIGIRSSPTCRRRRSRVGRFPLLSTCWERRRRCGRR